MKAIHVRVVAVLLAVSALSYAYWPAAPLPPAAPLFSGIYITESPTELSWIALTQSKADAVTCIWNKITLLDDGQYKQENIELLGTAGQNRVDMAAHLVYPVTADILGAAERKGDEIRLTLRLRDKVIYTGEYKPSDRLSMIVAMSRFKQSAVTSLEQYEKSAAPAPADVAKKQVIQANRNQAIDYNANVRHMKEFLSEYKETEDIFTNNTAQIQRSLQNIRQLTGADNGAIREHVIKSMKGLYNLTQIQYMPQKTFIDMYEGHITFFVNELVQKQKKCLSDGKKNAPSASCEEPMLKAITEFTRPVEKAIAEFNESYRHALALQQQCITDAGKVE